jgi:hypothetical protein
MLGNIRRLAVPRTGENAIIIEWGEESAILTWGIIEHMPEHQITMALRTQMGRDDAWVHRNQDRTLAVAVGEEPTVWPEDAPPPPQ